MASALVILSDDGRNYAEIQHHASGSEAEVYTATYVPTADRVALKVLSPRPAGAASRERREKRFLREASLLRKAGGAHVARVYEVLEVRLHGQETKAFSMEWLPATFRDLTAGHGDGVPAAELGRRLREALEGLAALHEEGVAVRDVRPENLLLSERGELKIADLGMARTDDSAASLVESSRYMAPEVLDGSVRDGFSGEDPPAAAYFASDVYGLGMIFYEAAVGMERWEVLPVFASVFGTTGSGSGLDRNMRWREWHVDRTKNLPPVREVRKDLPEALANVLDGMVRKDRTTRLALDRVLQLLGPAVTPASAEGERTVVSAAAEGPSKRRAASAERSPRWLYGMGALILVAALGWVGYRLIQGSSPPPTSHAQETPAVPAPAAPAAAANPVGPRLRTLEVVTEPLGADVFVGGVLRGASPVTVTELEDGKEYEIQVAKKGYVGWTRRIRAGTALPVLRVELQKVPPGPPPAAAKQTIKKPPTQPSGPPTKVAVKEPESAPSAAAPPSLSGVAISAIHVRSDLAQTEARKTLRRAIELLQGIAGRYDRAQACALAAEAAATGDAVASMWLAILMDRAQEYDYCFPKRGGDSVTRIIIAALPRAKELAQAGDLEAIYTVGWAEFTHGVDSNRVDDEDLAWLRLAAAHGYLEAMWTLGYHCANGWRSSCPVEEGYDWLRRAAKGGHVVGMTHWAYWCRGAGRCSRAESMMGLQRAAETGYPRAMFWLGESCRGRLDNERESVAEDVVQAVRWYERAAKAGDCDAMYELSQILYDGRPGVPANRMTAAYWDGRRLECHDSFYREREENGKQGTGDLDQDLYLKMLREELKEIERGEKKK